MAIDMTIPDPREAKLPAWAREMLTQARRRVKEAEKGERNARLATDPLTSDMIIDRYDAIPIGLGRKPTVRAVLSRRESGEVDHYIDFRMTQDGKGVEVMAWTMLTITPQVTNVVILHSGQPKG